MTSPARASTFADVRFPISKPSHCLLVHGKFWRKHVYLFILAPLRSRRPLSRICLCTKSPPFVQALLQTPLLARRSAAPSQRAINAPHVAPHRAISHVTSCQAAAAPLPPPSATPMFADLLAAAGASGCVALAPTRFANGLCVTRTVQEGDVLLRVPRESCLLLDYDVGLSVRNAAWPELKRGLENPDALPWDLLLALALVDAWQGNGDPFWQEYAAQVLPPPHELTMPFCQSPDRLEQLQHPRVAANATTQQNRLAATFPHLSTPFPQPPAVPGPQTTHPTLLEWAFACVRSRAFRLGESTFAFVPFLDIANHAVNANSNFRTADDGAVELRALEGLEEGAEVTVSYTGPAGATNQRLLVQYGFVEAGNVRDRLDLGLVEGFMSTQPLVGAPGEGLSLAVLQEHMGDGLFTEMVSGRAPALLSALKSVPTYNGEHAAVGFEHRAGELALVADLRRRLAAVEVDFSTTLEQDEALRNGGGGAGWDAVALEYRIGRKRLAGALSTILRVYERVVSAP